MLVQKAAMRESVNATSGDSTTIPPGVMLMHVIAVFILMGICNNKWISNAGPSCHICDRTVYDLTDIDEIVAVLVMEK